MNANQPEINWDAFNEFMRRPAPTNESRTIKEYTTILAYWEECEPQTGMPRGIMLDDQVIQEIPPMHKIVLGAVKVNTHKDAGQVFPLPGNQLGLGAQVYLAVAGAGGISFPDEASGIDMAASRFPDRVVAKVGSLRIDLAGQPQLKTGVYVLDIETKVEAERAKGGKSDAELDRYRLILRESSAQRAITGAQRAAVKAHYGKLRRKWFEMDFAAHLLVPRMILDKGAAMTVMLSFPEGRTAFADAVFGAQRLAFGAPRREALFAPAPMAQLAAPVAETFVDQDDDEPAGPTTEKPKDPPPADDGAKKAKAEKAAHWRTIYGDATKAGIAKADAEARARDAAVRMGATPGASSDTWTPEQWAAAEESVHPVSQPEVAGTLPEDEPVAAPAAVKIPETADAFAALGETDQVAVLEEMLRTRVLTKAPSKKASEVSPAMRAAWFDSLIKAPLKEVK